MIRHDRTGFTLIELLINVAILAAIAIPAYVNYRDRAQVARARADLAIIYKAIEQLAIDTNMWPGKNPIGATADEEVWDLNAKSAGLVATDGKFPNW